MCRASSAEAAAAAAAVVLLSGGLDSATALAMARAQGFAATRCRSPTASGTQPSSMRPRASHARWRRVRASRHARRSRRHRRLGADRPEHRGARAAERRHSGHLRAGAQHHHAGAGAGLGGGARARGTSSSASMRSTTRAIPTAGRSSSRPSRHLAALATKAGVEGTPSAMHAPLIAWTKAEIIRAGMRARRRLRRDRVLLSGGRAGAGLRPLRFLPAAARRLRGAGVPDPTRYQDAVVSSRPRVAGLPEAQSPPLRRGVSSVGRASDF